MTNLRLKTVFRYDEIQGHFRLFRVMWERASPESRAADTATWCL